MWPRFRKGRRECFDSRRHLRPGVCKDNSWRGLKSAIFRHRNQSRGAHCQSPCASRSYEHSLSGHDQTLVRWRRGFEPTHSLRYRHCGLPRCFQASEIGRASCRERVCQYVSISVVAVSLKKTTTNKQQLYEHHTQEKPRKHHLGTQKLTNTKK